MNTTTISEKQNNIIESRNCNKLLERLKYDNNMRYNRTIYHYTTLDALNKIIRNKQLRLTRINESNDKAEGFYYSKSNMYYMISFCNTTSESTNLWSLYGKGYYVRIKIGFPVNLLVNSINNNVPYYIDDKNNVNELFESDRKLTDIIYAKKLKKYEYTFNDKKLNIKADLTKRKEFCGIVKYSLWSEEKEVRVLVNTKNIIDSKYIYMKLDDELISNMSICVCPWINADDIKEDINKIFTDSNNNISLPKINNSLFYDQLEYDRIK